MVVFFEPWLANVRANARVALAARRAVIVAATVAACVRAAYVRAIAARVKGADDARVPWSAFDVDVAAPCVAVVVMRETTAPRRDAVSLMQRLDIVARAMYAARAERGG